MATDPFDNFLFNADGINQSFPNQFQQNDDTFDGNGNPFIDAAQLIDIDLMEHCEFSIDNNDIDNDLSKVASYFGRNWPSFENLHLNYINNEKRTTNVECHNASKKILKINVNKNLNLGDISGKICKDKTSNPKSVHFTISQYTRFELDFLRIRNKTDCVVELCFAFSIDKLSSCLLSTSQHNLILHSKIELNQNLGHLIANRCGQIVLQISFLAFCTKKRIHSVQTLNCHLNVVSLQIERPLVCTNGQDTIDLTCFEGGPMQMHDILFQMPIQYHLDRSFVLKLCLESHSPLVTLAPCTDNVSSSIVKCHLVNHWTCLLLFVQPNSFRIRVQTTGNVELDQVHSLTIYSCDSFDDQSRTLMHRYQIRLSQCKANRLCRPCVQTSLNMTMACQFFTSRWKRIDLRNKDDSQHVSVCVRLQMGHDQMEPNVWKCTATNFVMAPHGRQTIFVRMERKLFEMVDARSMKNDGNDDHKLQLCFDQFGGMGPVLTAAVSINLTLS